MSSTNLLAKFDELVKRFKEEFNEIIQGERAKLKAEVEQYNAEKERMKPFEVSDDDIIHLNVGGQKLTSTRSTLCQVEGSLLATMFSGRWEDGLKRDEDGVVFFDVNPQYFGYILDYLRMKKLASPKNPELPNVPRDQVKNFNTFVEYLGLSDEIVVPVEETVEIVRTQIVPGEKFNLHAPEITLQDDGKLAVHQGQNGCYQYGLGENTYQHGIVRLKLNLESFQSNYWMFVGIVKGDGLQQNNYYSHGWPGSYGWALGTTGQVWEEGAFTYDTTLENLTMEGDTVELVLDCDAAKLSLHLPTGEQLHIDLPKSQTWRLNVNLLSANDKIRIINE
ncbi:SH3KBP1-binding 1 [Paramuricea clavata]|uniref:SH3KBP1-binding 1 n=1 Tax=Paramuricea clavata TaxID=317549 RepID=A0A6S7KIQ7_PARCT|nr:SH3KBP1-binding 1 [Paramuricea clavata]